MKARATSDISPLWYGGVAIICETTVGKILLYPLLSPSADLVQFCKSRKRIVDPRSFRKWFERHLSLSEELGRSDGWIWVQFWVVGVDGSRQKIYVFG